MGKASRIKREAQLERMNDSKGTDRPIVRAGQVSVQQSLELSTGPTPPPAHVETYERLCPGATNRFLVLAEGEAAHRRKHEDAHLAIIEKNANTARNLAYLGMGCALAIAIVSIYTGATLALAGSNAAGSIIGGGGLATIVLAFLQGGKQKQQSPQKRPPDDSG